MNIIHRLLIERGARTDGRAGLDSVEDRVTADLGPRPKLDPSTNHEHAELVRVLSDRARVEELREDVTHAEDEKARHAPAVLYTTGIALTVAIETIGAILIMRSFGVSSTERLPLAVALAVALLGLTAVTAHRTSTAAPGDQSKGGLLHAAKRSLGTVAVLIGYTVVVLAIAIIRIRSSTDEDSSQLEIIAQALLMLTTSIGPAWLTEWLVRRRAPAAAVQKELRIVRRRLRNAEQARTRAQDAANKIARDGANWDAEAARRRALYRTTHRLIAKETE